LTEGHAAGSEGMTEIVDANIGEIVKLAGEPPITAARKAHANAARVIRPFGALV
jgi:hypothetical protein